MFKMIKAIKYKTCKDRTKYSKDRQIIIKIEIMHSTNNTEKQIMYICVYIYMYTHIFYTHTHTHTYMYIFVFKPVAQMIKNLPAVRESQVRSLG